VVTRDVPDFALVLGNPARIAGWMCSCGNRIELAAGESDGFCKACHTRYQKIGKEVRAA
jgi:UDP-2-acetamido-3-amino-2,3-dideoxy-glucuronate N-acetyltransferase